LRIYGHASFTPDDKNQKGAIETFRRVGVLLEGEKSVVVHVLNEQDRHWTARETGVQMPPGPPSRQASIVTPGSTANPSGQS
jgi:hypothetical protein